jgi:hypothetical protein
MADADLPSVSGTLIHSLVEVAREKLGHQVVTTGFGSAPGDAGAVVVNATPGQWIPIAAVETAFESLAKAAGRDLPALHIELARIGVERTIRRFWRMLLKVTSDSALVSRTPVIFAKSYNRGRLVPAIVAPGRGHVELVDWPQAPEWPVRGTRAGIEAALTVAGRQNVRADVKRTATGAVYSVTWEK